jgi:hypothetical protein
MKSYVRGSGGLLFSIAIQQGNEQADIVKQLIHAKGKVRRLLLVARYHSTILFFC